MEKLKLCEICGKEVIPGRDKHLNILNRYWWNRNRYWNFGYFSEFKENLHNVLFKTLIV